MSALRQVSDDEHLLSRSDQAEVAAGEFFDGGGVIAEPPGLFTEAGVLGALAAHRGGQPVVLTSRPNHRQQPPIADERLDDNDRRDEKDDHLYDAADGQ